MERTEAELIAAVLKGDAASFEPLVQKYSPRVFATARRYARRDSEVEDIAQEVWLKAFDKLKSFRGEAPFEHWLMRMTVRTCYDFLRRHQRNRESSFSELSEPESDWLERFVAAPESALAGAGGAPLLARDLAEPPEAELRKRVLAELSRPSGADPVQFAAGMEKANVERFIYWMQTWVHDLLRVRLAGAARHHGDLGAALKARAQSADVEGLFALERELAAARRLASHPLNPRLVAEHLLMAYNQATRPKADETITR